MPYTLDRPTAFAAPQAQVLPLWLVTKDDVAAGDVPDAIEGWISANGFKGGSGAFLTVPGKDGRLAGAVFGLGAAKDLNPFATGRLSKLLPKGNWRFHGCEEHHEAFSLAYALGAYRFDHYQAPDPDSLGASRADVALSLPDSVDRDDLERRVAGVYLARDLINTPANDMGPDALEEAFHALGARYGARMETIAGAALLERNFPLIHAVGRASAEAPRLLDMRWGKSGAPKITLVGKGVCFDTGGLDLKPASNMLLMKKDMGGAANVLGLALMLMDAGLDIDLRVLVPAVENAVAGNAFRPGDILKSRKGLSVEIGNTDAEGRLVLADALAYADEDKPDLMIDMATLTGAARVALGPDIAPYYTDDDALVAAITQAQTAVNDPVWRMPLFTPYDGDLASKVATLNNAPSGGFAGSITAALFLRRFVEEAASWIHFDIYGWNPKDKPHCPVGGEAQGIRMLYAVLRQRFG